MTCTAPVQLDMFDAAAQLTALDDDETEWGAVPFVQIVGPAAGKPAPKITAPRSVFELAGMPFTLPARGEAEKAPEARYAAVVEVSDGVRRCVGAAFPSRWTPEDEERERQRRARQRPPKPSKKARTKGKKLMELVGEN